MKRRVKKECNLKIKKPNLTYKKKNYKEKQLGNQPFKKCLKKQ